jgi:hypothetical protein
MLGMLQTGILHVLARFRREDTAADLPIRIEPSLTQAYRRGVTDGIAMAREKAMRALAEPIEGEEGESPINVLA